MLIRAIARSVLMLVGYRYRDLRFRVTLAVLMLLCASACSSTGAWRVDPPPAGDTVTGPVGKTGTGEDTRFCGIFGIRWGGTMGSEMLDAAMADARKSAGVTADTPPAAVQADGWELDLWLVAVCKTTAKAEF